MFGSLLSEDKERERERERELFFFFGELLFIHSNLLLLRCYSETQQILQHSQRAHCLLCAIRRYRTAL